ncbi:MAG: LPS export ABC transporter permease LptF [Thermodesulfobacteriota bacterium]|jgi:lipopolysaccharide export system permease protein
MGRILSRYIVCEIVPPFLFGLLIFTFVLFTARVLKLVELVVNRGVSPLQIAKIFLHVTPAFFEITVPMAFLLGLLWGFGRLAADREILALKGCGVSLYQMALPVTVCTVFIVGATLCLTLYVTPWSNASLKALLYEITKTHATAGLKEKTFNNDFQGLVIYAEEIHPPGNLLHGVMIADSRDKQRKDILFAPTGLVISDEQTHLLTLRLLDGTMNSVGTLTKSYQTTHFSVYDVTLNLGLVLAEAKEPTRNPQEMSLGELRAVIRQKQQEGAPSHTELVEWYRRFALPFSCVVFTLLALPLSTRRLWSPRSHGFAMSLGLIFAYYLLLTTGETLGKKGALPPVIAAWLPNVVLGGVGLALFRIAAQEKSLTGILRPAHEKLQLRSPALVQTPKT